MGSGWLQAKEGHTVPAMMIRQGRLVQLELMPAKSDVPGLLGCHLLPL